MYTRSQRGNEESKGSKGGSLGGVGMKSQRGSEVKGGVQGEWESKGSGVKGESRGSGNEGGCKSGRQSKGE